jgi:tetratricopeptide (TPR) repeat protein
MILESKAHTLYNLASAHIAAKEYGKAIGRTKAELYARKQIQDIDPFGQLPYIARARDLLGDTYLQMKKPYEALKEREKVVKLYKTLAKRFPDEHLLNLGRALNHCSNMYSHMKSYNRYFQSMQEALEIFRQLAVTDPNEYLITVACLLGNVCHYYEQISPNREKAVENARESYRILSSIERDETAEIVYANVKRIIGLPAS